MIAPRRFFLPQKYSTFDDIMKIVILGWSRMNRLQYDMFLNGRCLHSAPTFSERSFSKVRGFERMEPVRLARNYLRMQISIRNSRFSNFYSGLKRWNRFGNVDRISHENRSRRNKRTLCLELSPGLMALKSSPKSIGPP